MYANLTYGFDNDFHGIIQILKIILRPLATEICRSINDTNPKGKLKVKGNLKKT